ncbi:MAG: DNA gyrase subunit A [Alphaproteobacteria bacterium]|nr:DNA gyrase subunit A [Alphaproteobacteria bacterium]
MSDPTSGSPIAASIIPINIEDEMRTSYLDYSMSVIIGRALPDVRDGLKPVHRRILYAMHDEGLVYNRRYSKCAGVVGEVLKKYHPHGDSAVYDALVRMAQPWSMRAPLVDGQGNFGSPDGDSAAAYRYTECRMTKVAQELLRDIEKETVSYSPNFDGNSLEPDVLPARFPNLLVNGSEGIAVGMATKVPPHNLAEVIDATVALIEDPSLTAEDLMLRHVEGPDFPTGGLIYGRAGIRDAYTTGRGRVVMRARTHFEDISSERQAIVVDELPFQVGANRIMEQVAGLVRDKKIEGISAIRDESDRTGRRVVIELKRDAYGEVVLNKLFKHTDLQATFGVILLAIVNGQPRVLTLKEVLQHYISHRRDVITRRSRYELRKAKERAHLVEGFLKALDIIDEIIALIRASATTEDARLGLMSRFEFSEIQARAILDMQLRRLTGMEREKLEEEYAELLATIERLEAILASDVLLMQVVKDELVEVRETFAEERRTRIVDSRSDLDILDLIAEEEQAITLSVNGYIKRTSLDLYQEQRRGGFGKKGMRTRDEDSVQEIFVANTHSTLLVFTTQGQVYGLPVYAIPEAGRDAKGKAIVNLVQLDPGDDVAAVLSIREFSEDEDLLFCSRQGLVKRTRLSEYKNLRSSGLRAYDCAEGDSLFAVKIRTEAEPELMIATRQGLSIRFPIEDVRHLGRVARGVKGIELQEGDEIVSMEVLAADDSQEVMAITVNGFGKRTPLDEYRLQSRGGKGIINIQTDERNGEVAGTLQVHGDDKVMLITDTGRVIKFSVDQIRSQGRNTKGVTLMRVGEDEQIVSVARVVEDDADEELDQVEAVDEVESADTEMTSGQEE